MMRKEIFIAFSAGEGNWFDRNLGRLIRFFTGGDSNHAFIIYWDEIWSNWLVVGANSNGLTVDSLEVFKKSHIITHIFRAIAFDLGEGLHKHVDDLNTRYNYTGLLGMSFVKIHEKVSKKVGKNPTDAENRLFCSEWVNQIIKSSMNEIQLSTWPGDPDDVIDPDTLCAECLIYSTYFEEIKAKDLIEWKHITIPHENL
jgi:hypothetical protein